MSYSVRIDCPVARSSAIGGTLRKSALGLFAVGLTFALSVVPAIAEDLKAADIHPAGYPNVVAIENLGKKLEVATNGTPQAQDVRRAACWATKRR